MSIKLLSIAQLCAFAALGQPVSLGLKAGVPLTNVATGAAVPRYVAGPVFEARLPARLAFEANLLYRPLVYGLARWEVPLLAKYRLPARGLEPFAAVGVSLNSVTGTAPTAVEVRHRHTHGFVAAAGAAKRLGPLRAAPEIRLTHWVDHNVGVHDAPVRSNLTQVELLVGLTFP